MIAIILFYDDYHIYFQSSQLVLQKNYEKYISAN